MVISFIDRDIATLGDKLIKINKNFWFFYILFLLKISN